MSAKHTVYFEPRTSTVTSGSKRPKASSMSLLTSASYGLNVPASCTDHDMASAVALAAG